MSPIERIILTSLVGLAFLGCNGCHGPITIHDSSDPNAYVDASDPCATACGAITSAKCTTAGQLDNPRCAPNCREDTAQPAQARMFPLACILAAGADASTLSANCGVTCP